MEHNDNSVMGTKFKVNLNMSPIEGIHLADVDWEVKVFTERGLKSSIVTKAEATCVDKDNYIIPIDSSICGAGRYYVTLTARIPDTDFPDRTRTEVKTAYTGVTINAQ